MSAAIKTWESRAVDAGDWLAGMASGLGLREKYMQAEIADLRAALAAAERDAERLDWLSENFFSDEKDDWDERQAPNSIKWKFFGPTGYQGDIRRVIDAAITSTKE